MSFKPQLKIPATYMRGGTSKGVFFNVLDLPAAAQVPGPFRDALLLRVIGSPDVYGKQIDGMGGATSSTSKVVILSPCTQPNHDVDYLFGQVSVDKAFVDWSGNCGNLSSAVGAFAISSGLVDTCHIPDDGMAVVRIWQTNIQKTIIAHIPMVGGQVQETGDFQLDGVTFPAAEIKLEFINPSAADAAMFPTGNLVDQLLVPNVGNFEVTMINAGIPTIFLTAQALGYSGTELQTDINTDPVALTKLETIRAYGGVRMGLFNHIDEAKTRQHTPKIAFVAPAKSYTSSSGSFVSADKINLLVRAMSMGQLHHAMMGTAAVAIGTAAAIPNTLVNLAAGGDALSQVTFGHPSGTLTVGAQAHQEQGQWQATKVSMSRSARVLMEGNIRVPDA
ncbi:MAG: 2-methylaconitate cis-trans isomerase PrpF [Gammaproteobacteria bacterium]|jgi:probable AcnD-accessory protein PrpF|tara:strand:- start:2020 stop:3192 length:1173 start_codon:yes stop_codon:yes gene_type:complete